MGCELDLELRRVRQSGAGGAPELSAGLIRAAAKSILLRAALQRRDAWPVQTGSAAGHPLVQNSLHGTGTLRLQGSLGGDPQGQSHLLRAMGGLRAVSHRSFSIRFPERA